MKERWGRQEDNEEGKEESIRQESLEEKGGREGAGNRRKRNAVDEKNEVKHE